MVRELSRSGIRGHFRIDFSAARTSAAAALLLGRSGLLCSGRARHPVNREFHSAFHGLERTSTAGNDLAGALLEGGGIRSSGHSVRHAGAGHLFAFGCISAD